MSRKSIVFISIISVFLFTQHVYASDVKINEILVHPSTNNKEWVELYNPQKIDVSGYWIDDDTDFNSDSGSSSKKSLSGMLGKDTDHPYIEISSMFNNSGDSVVLFSSDGIIIDQYKYDKDPGVDISIGRTPDGSGDFAILQSVTQGNSNSNSQPTVTLTPTNTPSPLPTLKPTHTPTSIPTTKLVTIAPSKTITSSPVANTSVPSSHVTLFALNNRISVTPGADSFASSAAEGSDSAILGASVSSTITNIPTPMKKEKQRIASLQTHKFPFAYIAIAIGGVVFIACGILIFLKMRERNETSI